MFLLWCCRSLQPRDSKRAQAKNSTKQKKSTRSQSMANSDGSAVQSTCCSSRGRWIDFQQLNGGSQPSITLAPGSQMSLLVLVGTRHTHRQSTQNQNGLSLCSGKEIVRNTNEHPQPWQSEWEPERRWNYCVTTQKLLGVFLMWRRHE